QFQNAEKNLAINRANNIKVPVGTQMVDTFANNNLPGQVATPVFNAAFNGASNGNGFANANFVSWLDQGQAGRLANSLAGAGTTGARYFCNLVGSGFGPCATTLGYTGAGAGYPINYFQANPYKTGEPVRY